ncbi:MULTISPECIES: ABC transporter substrate-binding protein [Pandoraea]|uniref:ABC transporter substrate-binding protein n=1 Tax=Pandoraea TaxID=93217 RepID=UPI001F5CCA22|nr:MULTISPECIES: ABC transporter substrate-binding protein [Pandoraea]MCI3203481.1 ABC transporter substrate-binding protein [Pandoraea sp. LA3]MDN4581507.1 ABC transporter substrate-binding protein [Pandoraea capi]
MRRTILKTFAAGLATAAAVSLGGLSSPVFAQQKPVELQFYYPVAIGGPVTKIINDLVADFEKDHPNIKIKPVYAGSYQDSVVKALTAAKAGTPPQLAVLAAADVFTLIDEDAVVPIDSIANTPADKQWLDGFYPALMLNSRINGHTWGVPFQRSTIVMYWNKDAFREAGLDPDHAPANWDELVSYAQKLTRRDASGNVTQWGIKVPSVGFAYWLFQAFTTPAGIELMNPAGTKTFLNAPQAVQSLQYWVDLTTKYKVMPTGSIEWGTTPKDFLEKKAAIVYTTTGNLTNIRTNATFPFGVGKMPAKVRGGSPTGGGNFYVFKKSTPEEKQAAMTFIKWATTPERAAQFGIDTGYVAVTPAAWDTPAMKQYVQKVPAAAVARDQLSVSVAEFSTHDNQRVTKSLNDAIQAAVTGTKSPKQALDDAQREADRILRPYAR